MNDPVAIREAPTEADIAAFLAALALPSPATTNAQRIDRIAALERVKAAASAAQVTEAIELQRSQRKELAGASFEKRHAARSIASQVALARRISPHSAARWLALAETLVDDLPRTFQAMADGVCSEWRASILARETACLEREHRREVDATLARELRTLSDRQLGGRARQLAYRLDPPRFVQRYQMAAEERRVSLRPAADGMTLLSALLPLTAGVACLTALKKAAASVRAAGDTRGEGQAMADTLVQRLTGAASPTAIPVELQLVMTDTALLGDSEEPAVLQGYEPMPAAVARQLLRDLPSHVKSWIRRLYSDPVTGQLAAIDTHRRCFDGTLRTAIITRDQRCRTPYCDGTIKHVDHVVPSSRGGPSTADNGQGLCEACNYAKQAPGWEMGADRYGADGAVRVTTPTGHEYTSSPPPLPGTRPSRYVDPTPVSTQVALSA